MLTRYYLLPTIGRLYLCTVEYKSSSHNYSAIYSACSSLAHATTRLMVRVCARLILWNINNFSANSIFPVSRLLYHQSLFLRNFHQSDLFIQIPCHHLYISNFFHQIISKHYLYISWKSIFSVSKLLYLYSIFLPRFHQYDLFRYIPCHKSYSLDFFHHIIFQYYIYIFWNTMFSLSKLMYHELIYLRHFRLSYFFHQILSCQ